LKKKIVIIGAGAVGGYIGAHLSRAGEDVTLIDPWPEHVEQMKLNGIHFTNPKEEYTIPVKAMHLCEVQSLSKEPVDMAFICTKSYDTEWAATLIRQYLASGGYIVSAQNSINEERIATIVGWGKTVGCIVSGIGVDLYKPGHILRSWDPGSTPKNVFRVGEVHGRVTERVKTLAAMMNSVDTAKVTTNLWGERWTKLVLNSSHNALSAVTGYNMRMMVEQDQSRLLKIKLSAEAVRVGLALGYDLEILRGMTPEKMMAAADGDPDARAEIEAAMFAEIENRSEDGRPSTAQDINRGRRSEGDYINGLVVAKGKEVGVPTPANAAMTDLLRRVEWGELKPDPQNIVGI
jgi:2-dehydropantoate 2-reductase